MRTSLCTVCNCKASLSVGIRCVFVFVCVCVGGGGGGGEGGWPGYISRLAGMRLSNVTNLR